jgi:heavy metal sensor kinase
MSLRRRLMLGHTAMLSMGLMLIAGWTYYEFMVENRTTDFERALEAQGNTVMKEVGEVLLYSVAPALALTMIGSWWLLNRALAPVRGLTAAAERVHLENLSERLPQTGNHDELDRLTTVFNAMLGRLEDSYARVREFTLHASHELKTPLTVMRGQIDAVLHDASTRVAVREMLIGQLDEIDRLTKIVDGLTQLARADAGQATLQRVPLPLDELLTECHADAQVLAEPRGVTVEISAAEPCTILADRHRMRQLLLIVVDNAIKYNLPGGRVSLALNRSSREAELTCANTGKGIPADKLSRVFDRFYRGDGAGNEQEEGCGLGLAIAEWIVRAHGGRIEIQSVPNQVTRVIIHLPLAHMPSNLKPSGS